MSYAGCLQSCKIESHSNIVFRWYPVAYKILKIAAWVQYVGVSRTSQHGTSGRHEIHSLSNLMEVRCFCRRMVQVTRQRRLQRSPRAAPCRS